MPQKVEAMANKPNIILIIIDCVRWDHIGAYGCDDGISPHFDALAEQGGLYLNAVADGGLTAASVGSLFTGLCGREHNAEAAMRLPSEPPVLAECLKQAGYHTVGVSANVYTQEQLGYTRGFEVYHSFSHERSLWEKVARYWAKVRRIADKGGRWCNATMLEHLRACPRPYFAYLHYNDAHMPYYSPRPYLDKFLPPDVSAAERDATIKAAKRIFQFSATYTKRQLGIIKRLYNGMVVYQDLILGQFVAGLRALGELDNSVLIVVADHGESLGERHLVGHGFGLDEPIVHVPMLVMAPGILESGLQMEGIVQLRDLPASLCEVAGAEGLLPSAAGTVNILSARRPTDGHPLAFSERRAPLPERVAREQPRHPDFDFALYGQDVQSARGLRYKFITWANGREELYDLESDPSQTRDLSTDHPDMCAGLREATEQWLDSMQPAGEAEQGQVSAEVERRLRGLGYIP